jgi:glycine cleavage system H protein
MNVPKDLKYSSDHEWVRIEGEFAYVGITDYAQSELGDVVYVDLPSTGDEFSKQDVFGSIEAVKAASDLYCPVGGQITEVNEDLSDNPEIINKDPYGDGWMVKIQLSDETDLGDLMDATAYEEHISE